MKFAKSAVLFLFAISSLCGVFAEPLAPIQWVRNNFRGFSDEYVYEPASFSDFTWSGDRQDAGDAIGNAQPENGGEYAGQITWHIGFLMNDHWYSGEGYANKLAPVVEFMVSSEYYSEEYGEWIYDNFPLYAQRTVTSWQISEPIDTFAHQRGLDSAIRSFNSMSNSLYNGETKVLRTGLDDQYGTGWGYFRRPVGSDYRSYRIRVPAVTVFPTTPSTSTVNSFLDANGTNYNYSALANPFAYCSPYWAIKRSLIHTDGTAGDDAVQLADYDVGVIRKLSGTDDGGFYLNYKLRNTSANPRIYEVTPDEAGFHREFVQAFEKTMLVRDVDLPDINGPHQYLDSTYGYCHVKFGKICVEPGVKVCTNTATFAFWLIDKTDWRDTVQTGGGTLIYSVDNVIHPLTVTFTYSTGLYEDCILPCGRVITSEFANLYYDSVLKATYRVTVSNGCYFSEWVSDKDWRKEEL